MVLSNYKCMYLECIFEYRIPETYSSNVSSNRIKIQENLLILQLETDYFSKLFISEMHSKQWHYSLHRDFQNCYSTRRSLTRFFSSNSSSNSTRAHYTTIQRILHPESNSTRRRQRALRVLLLHTEGKGPSFQKRNSTHRRQGDLLEMHPCVLQDIPVVPDTPETFQAFQSFMTFQPSKQFYNAPVSPGNPPHSSILRLEYIFYSSIGFHRKLHRVPVGQLQTLQTSILQRKGDVAISVKLTYFPE